MMKGLQQCRFKYCITAVLTLTLNACATSAINPRVGAPPTVAESLTLSQHNEDSNTKPLYYSPWLSTKQNKKFSQLTSCQNYAQHIKDLKSSTELKAAAIKAAASNDQKSDTQNVIQYGQFKAHYKLELAAAKSRARCFQEQLLLKLDQVEDLEIATRMSLFILGLGATAAGFFDAPDSLIASLGLGAGITTGIRGFHPLEQRQVLYFTAMAALECSILTAEQNSLEQNEMLTTALYETLSRPTDCIDSTSHTPLSMAQSMAPENDLGVILNYSMRSNLDISTNCGAAAKYMSYLPQNLSHKMNDADAAGGIFGSGNLSKISGNTSMTLSRLDTPGFDILSTIFTANSAKLEKANNDLVKATVDTYVALRQRSLNAPKDLDNATTLISLLVNDVIVKEQPDVSALVDAARNSITQFLGDVQKGKELAELFATSQKEQVDATTAEMSMMAGALDAQKGSLKNAMDDKGDSVTDAEKERMAAYEAATKALDEFNKAANDITETRASISRIISMIDDYAHYPKACQAIVNGNNGGNP